MSRLPCHHAYLEYLGGECLSMVVMLSIASLDVLEDLIQLKLSTTLLTLYTQHPPPSWGLLTSRESHWFSPPCHAGCHALVTHKTWGRFSHDNTWSLSSLTNAVAGLNKNDPENRVTHNGRPAPSRALRQNLAGFKLLPTKLEAAGLRFLHHNRNS